MAPRESIRTALAMLAGLESDDPSLLADIRIELRSALKRDDDQDDDQSPAAVCGNAVQVVLGRAGYRHDDLKPARLQDIPMIVYGLIPLSDRDGWTWVVDSLPDAETAVLVMDSAGQQVDIGYYRLFSGGQVVWRLKGRVLSKPDVTHWRPLPSIPRGPRVVQTVKVSE